MLLLERVGKDIHPMLSHCGTGLVDLSQKNPTDDTRAFLKAHKSHSLLNELNTNEAM